MADKIEINTIKEFRNNAAEIVVRFKKEFHDDVPEATIVEYRVGRDPLKVNYVLRNEVFGVTFEQHCAANDRFVQLVKAVM